ncbi:class I SAM-dependent methyltransferase [Acinetobacter indicus]|uniref:class I SAM-dependent methyltransferase n=1 Tax=Acinetobacter indicus TaxID=756892 RepID=UPI0025776DC6|nr:class I SAM-dependent methyltransferase [Acinetobacter indicus]MDM1277785.1 class I SAM-dependent methyltransferase [Acinetobacter indicus]
MAKNFHSEVIVAGYDDHIRKLIPGYELVHQQIDAILTAELPETAHILVVGCGTGYELTYLLAHHPQWQITAIDPSRAMLEQAQNTIRSIAGAERVQFIQADTQSLESPQPFDAALAILVAHFIPMPAKADFFQDICPRLKPGGVFLSYDLMQPETLAEQQVLQHVAVQQGLTVRQSEKMIARLDDDFELVSAEQTKDVLTKVGFKSCRVYCQIMNYYGFFARK